MWNTWTFLISLYFIKICVFIMFVRISMKNWMMLILIYYSIQRVIVSIFTYLYYLLIYLYYLCNIHYNAFCLWSMWNVKDICLSCFLYGTQNGSKISYCKFAVSLQCLNHLPFIALPLLYPQLNAILHFTLITILRISIMLSLLEL